jgi:hypothetical protein
MKRLSISDITSEDDSLATHIKDKSEKGDIEFKHGGPNIVSLNSEKSLETPTINN